MEQSAQRTPTYEDLKAHNVELQEIVEGFEAKLKQKDQIIADLQQKLYGKKSEKSKKKSDGKRAKGKKKPKGMQDGFNDDEDRSPQFPEHLERKDIFQNNLPEDANIDDYEAIGTKVREQIAVRPATYYVEVIHFTTYKKKNSDTIPPKNVDPHPLGRCCVAISFIIHAIVLKVLFHVPFYRQEQILRLEGVSIHRSNFIRWSAKVATILQPIVDALLKEIKTAPVKYADETPALVRYEEKEEEEDPQKDKKESPGKKKKEKSKGEYKDTYFWNLVAPLLGIVFRWSKRRNKKTAAEIFNDTEGILVSDALHIYPYVTKQYNLTWQLCWIHIRRGFIKAYNASYLAEEALTKINMILGIDKRIRRRTKKNVEGEIVIDYERRQRLRQRFLQPLVDRLRSWIDEKKVLPEVQADVNLKNAFHYLDGRWNTATCFITNSNVLPHNNLAEQYFRHLKLGIKNWQFCASEWGAETIASLYSLIYSAKMLGIHPYYYLLDVLEQIQKPGANPEDLTPAKCKKNREKLVMSKFIR